MTILEAAICFAIFLADYTWLVGNIDYDRSVAVPVCVLVALGLYVAWRTR